MNKPFADTYADIVNDHKLDTSAYADIQKIPYINTSGMDDDFCIGFICKTFCVPLKNHSDLCEFPNLN